MNALRRIGVSVSVIAVWAGSPSPAQVPEDIITAMWSSPSEAERLHLGRALAEVPFRAVLEALRAGPVYAADVPTGRLDRVHDIHDVRHPYFVVVPASYNKEKRYPVRFFLHGGVGRRPEWHSGGAWWERWEHLASDDYLAVFPAAWSTSPWWSSDQVDNLAAILVSLKGVYNIDENRVYLVGVSDGGSGAYVFAFKDATRWAGFVPLIAHPAVLNNPRLNIRDELYVANLSNRPLFIVNARDDRLYPAESMGTFVEAFRAHGVDFEFRVQPGEHGISWWPEVTADLDAFLDARPRRPYPDRLTWETERTDRYNRLHWVRIDEIDETADVLSLRADPFPHRRPAGRVAAVAHENEIRVATRDVHRFTLLLSPEVFEFTEPVTVVLNGRTVYNGWVTPSTETLVKWAAADLDRTMLFGAELPFEVP